MFHFPQQMKRVFKDPLIQQDFEKNGFVKLPFYNEREIEYLTGLYEELHPAGEKGFYPSTFSKNKNYRQKTDEELQKVGARSINVHLQDIVVVCGSFIVKYPGPDSVMGVHQDMTLVDESEFTGINIWCPLVNLTENNGVLYVLPKSHRLFPTYRGASIPNIYDDVFEDLIPKMTPLFLKAGEAVFFDQSIIHYSPPNLSDQKRIVTNIYFTHKNARFLTAYYPKETHPNKIELFEQDMSFMTNFEQFGENIFSRPKIGKSLGLVPYNFPKINQAMLSKFGENNQGIFQRIKKFIRL